MLEQFGGSPGPAAPEAQSWDGLLDTDLAPLKNGAGGTLTLKEVRGAHCRISNGEGAWTGVQRVPSRLPRVPSVVPQ